MTSRQRAVAGAVSTLILFFLFWVALAHAAPTAVQISNGGTGTTTAPSYGYIPIGGKNGEYEYVASSTFGGGGGGGAVSSVFGRSGAVTAQSGDYTTSQVTEGTNLYYTLARWASALAGTTTDALAEGVVNKYFTDARAVSALTGQDVSIFSNDADYLTPSVFDTSFDSRLTATTSLPHITTLSNLSLPYTQLTGTPNLAQYLSLSAWFSTTTDQLKEGSTNFYFTNARAVSALTGQNVSIFNNNAGYLTSLAGAASSTVLSDNNTFSGINLFSNASSNFSGTWQTFSPSHFQVAGSYDTFGYPFPSNATSTNITFSGGLTGALTGNASTATTLQTARTINGVSFNGSANIVVASTTLLANNNTFSGTTNFTGATTLAAASSTSFAVTGQTGGCAQFNADGALTTTGTTCDTAAGTVTAVTGVFPIQSTGGSTPALSLAFGTTTANSWSATQTFTNTVGTNSTTTNATTTTEAVSSLTSGDCVQAGIGGILTSASGACGSGGGGTPGGSSGQVQYNNSGSFGGAANLTYSGGNVGIGTSTPNLNLSIASTSSVVAAELQLATSTTMSIGMASSSNQLLRYSTSNITATFSNYDLYAGQKMTLTTCDMLSGTAGVLTFGNVHYSGGVQPGNTTAANQCDMWYFQTTAGTSSPIIVLTGMTPGIQ